MFWAKDELSSNLDLKKKKEEGANNNLDYLNNCRGSGNGSQDVKGIFVI